MNNLARNAEGKFRKAFCFAAVDEMRSRRRRPKQRCYAVFSVVDSRLYKGLNLEWARGPKACNWAVGPRFLLAAGPVGPLSFVLHSTFLSETILKTFFKVYKSKKLKNGMILNILSFETFKAYTLGSMSFVENFRKSKFFKDNNFLFAAKSRLETF